MDECDNPVVVSLGKLESQQLNEGVAEPSAENSDQEQALCDYKEPNIDDKEALIEQDLHKSSVEEDAANDAEVEAVIMVPQ